MVVYVTNEYKGYGKQNYYYYEYRLENNVVKKIKCHRFKSFNGDENEWIENEKEVESWKIGDENMPDWLVERLQQ